MLLPWDSQLSMSETLNEIYTMYKSVYPHKPLFIPHVVLILVEYMDTTNFIFYQNIHFSHSMHSTSISKYELCYCFQKKQLQTWDERVIM